jgi:DNA-binding beta-propeller fold protein YncE
MKKFRLAGVIAGLLFSLLLAGCGDQYRPVITPFPTHGTDPQSQTTVFVANAGVRADGSACATSDPCPGSTTDIDVPGDINMGNHVVGESPWSAVLIGSALYTANRNSNNVSWYVPFVSGSVPNTISLDRTATVQTNANPSNLVTIAPSFIATKQGSTVFVAMPACATVSNGACTAFDQSTPGVLGIINTSSNQLIQKLQMDLDPVAMVELADTSKLYVVNQGDGSSNGTVVVVNPQTNTILSPTISGPVAPLHGIPVGLSPVWATATTDNKFVFVLNSGSNNTVSVISTANDSATIPVISSDSNGNATLGPLKVGSQSPRALDRPLQNPMFFDSALQRLYVTNPGDNTVSIFDTSKLTAASPTMDLLATVSLPVATVPPALPVTPGVQPFSIAVLPNGFRAYVLNAGNGIVGPSVSIINTNDFTVSQLSDYFGSDPRGIVASFDGSKVYVAYHEQTTVTYPSGSGTATKLVPPGTAVFKTLDNSTIRDSSGAQFPIAAPFRDPVNCTADTCARQKPVLIFAQ